MSGHSSNSHSLANIVPAAGADVAAFAAAAASGASAAPPPIPGLQDQALLEQIQFYLSHHHYDQAYQIALNRMDPALTTALCFNVPTIEALLSYDPSVLSQKVLFDLVEQLSDNLNTEAHFRLMVLSHAIAALNPMHPPLAARIRPVLERLWENCTRLDGGLSSRAQTVMHIIRSVLRMCK